VVVVPEPQIQSAVEQQKPKAKLERELDEYDVRSLYKVTKQLASARSYYSSGMVTQEMKELAKKSSDSVSNSSSSLNSKSKRRQRSIALDLSFSKSALLDPLPEHGTSRRRSSFQVGLSKEAESISAANLARRASRMEQVKESKSRVRGTNSTPDHSDTIRGENSSMDFQSNPKLNLPPLKDWIKSIADKKSTSKSTQWLPLDLASVAEFGYTIYTKKTMQIPEPNEVLYKSKMPRIKMPTEMEELSIVAKPDNSLDMQPLKHLSNDPKKHWPTDVVLDLGSLQNLNSGE
jgi:hypothetical protein